MKANLSITQAEDCNAYLETEYALNLGAHAGVFLEVADRRIGPEVETSTAIYTTTFPTLCVTTTAVVTTPPAKIKAREDEETSEIEVIQRATRCLKAGLLNCTASLREVEKVTQTVMAIASIAADGEAIFTTPGPKSTVTPVAFGKSVYSIRATSGSLVAYVAKETGSSDGSGQGVSGTNMNLVVGLSVGLGVPFLIAIVVGIM